MTSTCFAATALAVLLLPILLLSWILETPRDRARRWHRAGISQRAIAKRLNCSRYRVRVLLT